ncbi:HNH endonuclease [Sphingomonas sp. NSE70-1]|uniref:HNH endonuclease n=1 Tax=Sphingomonas caseinilyticus TaxID=2908205 RepID=A0ABT0RXT3_9SPHN|nr:HNH endonuclease [Sphingomonas caseinilyticus]MCL6699540.1 HNH endonuclease [Sphingomonas caseinilyticus]
MKYNTVTLSRFETVVAALHSLGGQARPAEIAEEVRRLFPGPHPDSLLQSVRARIQECSSDSNNWKGKRDLFYSVHGIGGGVWGLRAMDPLNPANEDGIADSAEAYMAEEGAATLRTHLRRERSRSLIDRFKQQLTSYACSICAFDFATTYGEIGHHFIEAHHKIPVSQLQPGAKTKLEDLAAVCSNCHRMLHRAGGISVDDLKGRLQS